MSGEETKKLRLWRSSFHGSTGWTDEEVSVSIGMAPCLLIIRKNIHKGLSCRNFALPKREAITSFVKCDNKLTENKDCHVVVISGDKGKM